MSQGEIRLDFKTNYDSLLAFTLTQIWVKFFGAFPNGPDRNLISCVC